MKPSAYIERNLQGFEGDALLKGEIERLVKTHNISHVIETGTFRGGSTVKFAEMVERVDSIEVNDENFRLAHSFLENCSNVFLHKGSSPEVLPFIIPKKNEVLFFLDAHWGNYCPLLDELKCISEAKIKPIIVIHDFYVPGLPELGYDEYNGQRLDLEYVKPGLDLVYGQSGYDYYYNIEAEGAKRGVLFVFPK